MVFTVVSHRTYLACCCFLVAPKSVTITGVREAKVGETLTLTCTTTNSNPAAVITWIPRGTTLLHDSSQTVESPDGGYITISHINVTLTHQQNTAMYTCEALNVDLGVRRSATAIVGVLCKYCYMQDNSAFVDNSFLASATFVIY